MSIDKSMMREENSTCVSLKSYLYAFIYFQLFKKKSSSKHSDGADKNSASKLDIAADTTSNTELTASAFKLPPHSSVTVRHKPARSSEGVVSSVVGLILDGFICAVSKSSSLIWSNTFPDSISSRPISAQHQNKLTNQSTAKKSKSGADKPPPHNGPSSSINSRLCNSSSSSSVQYGPAGNRVERFIYGIFSFFFGVLILGFSFGVFVLWLILSLFIGPVSALTVTVGVVIVFVLLLFINSRIN